MKDAWRDKVESLRFNDGKSWTEIAQEMAAEFPSLTISQVREKCRDHCRSLPRYKEQSEKPTLVFSDPHVPFDHKNFPDFLRDTYKKYKCGKVVCLGDLIDNHAISNHSSEACALGAYSELDLAISRLKVYAAYFPEVEYVYGNHDCRPERIAGQVGIGTRYLKDMHEVLELPDGWVCRGDEFMCDDVLYTHGINCAGKNGALNKAINERMSVAIGHAHAFGGCAYSANKRDTVFGLNVGCGIDENAYAFIYGKHAKNRVTRGCGIVFDSENAIFVPMGREYLREITEQG